MSHIYRCDACLAVIDDDPTIEVGETLLLVARGHLECAGQHRQMLQRAMFMRL